MILSMNVAHKIFCIILAGGKGSRLNPQIPKQFLKIDDKSILELSILEFYHSNHISKIQLVINPSFVTNTKEQISKYGLLEPVTGGKTRQESVLNGLKAICKYKPDYVLIHDAARPFIDCLTIQKIVDSLKKNDAVVPAVKLVDSLKYCEDNIVIKSVARDSLYQIQTPQAFKFDKIYKYHLQTKDNNFTDDASIFENFGEQVKIIEGSINNFKITTNEDLQRAKDFMLTKQSKIRTGIGYDVHKFCNAKLPQDNFIKLCGVKVPSARSLEGHSDADVGIHAIVDAILGSLAMGDIGDHFPPSDDSFKDVDSAIFLEFCKQELSKKSSQINNIDVTIICEKPKISSYKNLMKKKIAQILDISDDLVNIKATTTEKLGFTGRGEGIACQAIATIEPI